MSMNKGVPDFGIHPPPARNQGPAVMNQDPLVRTVEDILDQNREVVLTRDELAALVERSDHLSAPLAVRSRGWCALVRRQ